MRLLNARTLQLESWGEESAPAYAILSHRWGEEEVDFSDIADRNSYVSKRNWSKIQNTCRQALGDTYNYVWIDTCCIDKSNSQELREAVTSMPNFYKRAAYCYVYLADVTRGSKSEETFADELRTSRWFWSTWVLQELMISQRVKFYDQHWDLLGKRSDLVEQLSKATGIPRSIIVQTERTALPWDWDQSKERPFESCANSDVSRRHLRRRRYICAECKKPFCDSKSLAEHARTRAHYAYRCKKQDCNSEFLSGASLSRHMNTCHSTEHFSCHSCDKQFNRKDNWIRHERLCNKSEGAEAQREDEIGSYPTTYSSPDSCFANLAYAESCSSEELDESSSQTADPQGNSLPRLPRVEVGQLREHDLAASCDSFLLPLQNCEFEKPNTNKRNTNATFDQDIRKPTRSCSVDLSTGGAYISETRHNTPDRSSGDGHGSLCQADSLPEPLLPRVSDYIMMDLVTDPAAITANESRWVQLQPFPSMNDLPKHNAKLWSSINGEPDKPSGETCSRQRLAPSGLSKTTRNHVCSESMCRQRFARAHDLQRHVQTLHRSVRSQLKCPECLYQTARSDKMREHCRKNHGQGMKCNSVEICNHEQQTCGSMERGYRCSYNECGELFQNESKKRAHEQTAHADYLLGTNLHFSYSETDYVPMTITHDVVAQPHSSINESSRCIDDHEHEESRFIEQHNVVDLTGQDSDKTGRSSEFDALDPTYWNAMFDFLDETELTF